MSGLFGGGGGNRAAEQQVEQQTKQIEKQEAREAVKSTELAQKTMAGIRARRGGGLRFLMMGTDEQPGKTTLGG